MYIFIKKANYAFMVYFCYLMYFDICCLLSYYKPLHYALTFMIFRRLHSVYWTDGKCCLVEVNRFVRVTLIQDY